ncbi:MAG TPA: hypothetical protein PLE74_13350, partial [Candidatus Cloacimonadota bacterium]|nr:hypothetical protein [Candidatus Cloacimonadota bacterium]
SQSVLFHVEARGIDILLLKLSRTYVEIDAKEMKNNTLSLNNYQIALPKYITLSSLTPLGEANVNYQTDDLAKKTVPIVLQFESDEVEAKFRQLPLEQNIVFAEISGPQKIMNNIEEIKSRPIEMKQLASSDFSVDLASPNKEINLVQHSVKLHTVKTEYITKTFSMIPISTANKQITIMPSWVSVKVQGSKSMLDGLSVNDFQASADASQAQINQYVSVNVSVSKPVRIIEFTPQKVRVQKNE